MKALLCAIVAAATLPAAAGAQSLTTEADVTVGASTEHVKAASTQLRLFGPFERTGWRVFFEGAWGGVWSRADSDAFGAAYPYDRRFQPMETYAERTFHPAGALAGVRVGRYRVPFGISGRSDHAYNGFLRAPLLRYGNDWTLANTFLETGVDAIAGSPSLYGEVSVGVPRDSGDEHRRNGLDTVARVQGFTHSLIVGASILRSQPSMPGTFVHGRMRFEGIDARWMHAGVQLRGEWITGRPFDFVATRGGYVDAVVHVMNMGWVTAVGRVERLDYDAGPFSAYYRRVTAGARVRVSRAISVQIDALHQPRRPAGEPPNAVDAGVTYTIRF